MGRLGRLLKPVLAAAGWQIERGPRAVLIRRVGRRPSPAGQWAARRDLKLNLGCGQRPFEGWVNVDIAAAPGVDLVSSVTELPLLPDGCAAEIRMDAVYEHLYRWERPEALAEWSRLLQPGGLLRINWLPDFDAIVRLYIEQAPGLLSERFDLEHVYRYTHGLPTRFNAPHQLHKDLFTKDSLRAELEAAGYEVVSLENTCYEQEPHALNLNVVARRRRAVAGAPAGRRSN